MRPKQQWGKRKSLTPLILLVRQAGFEPATYGLEVRCSIQLSYWRLWDGRCRAYNIIGEIIILKAGQKATAFVSMFTIYGFLPTGPFSVSMITIPFLTSSSLASPV